MLIKDQIRARRQQLGVEITDLARRIGVSAQAVRHWETGRSYPSKTVAQLVESELNFILDWTEGARNSGERTTADALLQQQDIDLLLIICRLPHAFKVLLGQLAQEHLDAIGRPGRQEQPSSVQPFAERKIEQRAAIDEVRHPDRSTPTRARRATGA